MIRPSEGAAVPANTGAGLRGIALVIASTLGFSLAHALVRAVSADIHPIEIAFFRSFFGLMILAPWLLRRGRASLATEQLGLQLLRVCISAVSLLTFYYALSLSPLAMVTAIGFTAPLFTTAMVCLFLGEAVRARRWATVVIGFAGALVILRPGVAALDPGLVVMLASTALFAVSLVLMKMLTRTDSALTVTAYNLVLMTPITLVAALFVWRWPTLSQFVSLAAVGVLSACSLLMFTAAMKVTDTSVVMPLDYLRLIWTILLGFVLFGEIPDPVSAVGMLMIAGAAAYLAWGERAKEPG